MTHQFILSEELNPLEIILKAIIYYVNRLYYFINKITGLLGIVILMPIFALVSFAVWILLKYANWRLQAITKLLFHEIMNADGRAVMLFHHAIKTRRIVTDQVIIKLKPTSNFFLFKPLFNQINVSRTFFLEAEERLHKTAYPHLSQPFTKEQQDLLGHLSKNLEGIWEDGDVVMLK